MKMYKLAVCLLFSLATLTGFSQKVYFIYLQTDNDQTFFVKMNSKIHSSSASGYLILSKLHDSTYNFAVGFPQNKWPEQNFTISINKKDHGYLLKNFSEKGWGLFDLQTLAVQMAAPGSAKVDEKKKEENNDVSAFTEILSKAADDPSLKEKQAQTHSKNEEKKTDSDIPENVSKEKPVELAKVTTTIIPVEITEQPEIKKNEPKIDSNEQQAIKIEEIITPVAEEYKPTIVTKRSESSTTEGFGLVFIDEMGNGISDTIRLLISSPKPVLTSIDEEPKEEKKFLEMLPDTIKKKEERVTDVILVPAESPLEKKAVKNNCLAVAEESDFFKLRKNMAAAEGDDNMLKEAQDYFKTMCFTTNQFKNLGMLFLSDEGKYRFFDLAYAFVMDIDKFSILQNELKEEYYINRFKAMLRN
jgi:hypothetical protein